MDNNINDKNQNTTTELSEERRSALRREAYEAPINEQRTTVGKIELLEERAVVDKERLDVGKITATKHVRTRTVNVPIELSEEVLVIDTEYYDADSQRFLANDVGDQDIIRHIEPTLNHTATIKVNGSDISLEDGPVEIVISRQVAVIKKETYAVQDIAIEKSTHVHKDSFEVELRHEELEVIEEGDFTHKNAATQPK